MDEDIKRKTALVLKIIQGKTSVHEASRGLDMQPPRRPRPGWGARMKAWRAP